MTSDQTTGKSSDLEKFPAADKLRGILHTKPSRKKNSRPGANQERARLYWAVERERAGIDEQGDLTSAAHQLATSSTLRHRVYAEFLKARDIKHYCPDHGSRQGYTTEFDPNFKNFADTVRDHFFAPWREHQKLWLSQGQSVDNFETLVLRFNQWVARYNDCVQQPSPAENEVEEASSNQNVSFLEYMQRHQGSPSLSLELPATQRLPR